VNATYKIAALSSVVEIKHLLGGFGDKRRPADILLPGFKLRQDYALDFAVTSPTQPSMVAFAATDSGEAARRYSTSKSSRYEAECAAAKVVYVPMVCETYGGWTQDAVELLETISDRATRREEAKQSTYRREFFQHLSVSLQRNNALKRDPLLSLPHINTGKGRRGDEGVWVEANRDIVEVKSATVEGN